MVFEVPRHFSEKRQHPVWSTFHDQWWHDVNDPQIQHGSWPLRIMITGNKSPNF